MEDYKTKAAPFIIGLTGAIGTGKSLVRKMLEHKGTLTIDADRLAHDVYAAGTKVFHELVRIFGSEILDREGQIDRKRLGEFVFKNSKALLQLESLIHPQVTQAIKRVIDLSPLPIIVIEAIKLLESDLHKQCDVIWEVASQPDDIYERLRKTRGMSRRNVDERLSHQLFLKFDRSLIDLTISNQGNIKTLWANVSALWDDLATNSDAFRPALSKTRELMQPFQKHLIQQNSALQEQAVMEINKRDLFFMPVKNLGFKNSFYFGENSDLARLKDNFIQYFLWRSAEEIGKTLYLISDIDNFSSTAAACIDMFDTDEFIKTFGILQDFLHLHLCEKLYFPFNKDTASLSEAMGFGQPNTSDLLEVELSPLGYNLLCKQLRPPLELFREK
jgi:dephospho-CoA kinase